MVDRGNGMFFLGIDPGISGGIALMTYEGGIHPEQIWKMPDTEKDIADVFRNQLAGQTELALIEKVHSMPKQGVASSFKFGMGYGLLRGMLIAYAIPFDDIPPITWQRFAHCLTHGDKNVSKAKAQQLFPHLRITHATADAILLAKLCRELALGLLPPPIKIIRQVKPEPQLEDVF